MRFNLDNYSVKEIRNLKFKYSLKLDWSESDIDTLGCYKITENNNIIALIELSYRAEVKEFWIDNFEVLEKSKGIGSKIISEIITFQNDDETYNLYFNSQKSLEFWKKQGFILIDDGTGCNKCYFSKKQMKNK